MPEPATHCCKPPCHFFCSLQSNTHAVLATLKRAQNDMSSYQRKMYKVDDHMGIAIAGLTADGRVLCKYMRNECINHRCDSPEPCSSTAPWMQQWRLAVQCSSAEPGCRGQGLPFC